MTRSPARSSMPIQEQRLGVRSLLVSHDPGDARTAYYALEHDPQWTALTLHRTDSGHPDGFLATCITGANPFQPLVVLRALGAGTLDALLGEALIPGRSYLFSVPVHVGAALEGINHSLGQALSISEAVIWRILRADASRFLPLINVLVTRDQGSWGLPRWQIRIKDRVIAAAGVNWKSSRWVELYVASEPAGRRRRWDESVLAAATSALHREGLTPLYPVMEDDKRAQQVAEARGYHDSGAREFTCMVTVECE
jgi:hypothetical protein